MEGFVCDGRLFLLTALGRGTMPGAMRQRRRNAAPPWSSRRQRRRARGRVRQREFEGESRLPQHLRRRTRFNIHSSEGNNSAAGTPASLAIPPARRVARGPPPLWLEVAPLVITAD